MHRRRESLMLHSSLEAAFEAAMTGHWPTLGGNTRRVSPGTRYLRQDGRIARHGRIIHAQPPITLALRELLVAPVPVMRVYFRYRFEPRGDRTLLVLETRLTLFAPARLTPWIWQARVSAENHHRLLRMRSIAEAWAGRPAPPPAAPWLAVDRTRH
jgi:hypothetical protein